MAQLAFSQNVYWKICLLNYSKSRVQFAKCGRSILELSFHGPTIPVIICWNTSGKHARHKLSRFMNTRTAFRSFPQCWFHARLLRHKRFRNQHWTGREEKIGKRFNNYDRGCSSFTSRKCSWRQWSHLFAVGSVQNFESEIFLLKSHDSKRMIYEQATTKFLFYWWTTINCEKREWTIYDHFDRRLWNRRRSCLGSLRSQRKTLNYLFAKNISSFSWFYRVEGLSFLFIVLLVFLFRLLSVAFSVKLKVY